MASPAIAEWMAGWGKQIIGPDNPTCSQFPPDTEFRLNAKKDKGKGEDVVKERVGKGI